MLRISTCVDFRRNLPGKSRLESLHRNFGGLLEVPVCGQRLRLRRGIAVVGPASVQQRCKRNFFVDVGQAAHMVGMEMGDEGVVDLCSFQMTFDVAADCRARIRRACQVGLGFGNAVRRGARIHQQADSIRQNNQRGVSAAGCNLMDVHRPGRPRTQGGANGVLRRGANDADQVRQNDTQGHSDPCYPQYPWNKIKAHK